MKVIFDCTALDAWHGHSTGIQRVIKELGIALSQIMPIAVTAIFDTEGTCFSYCPQNKTKGEKLIINQDDMIFCSGHDWDHIEHFDRLCLLAKKGIKLGVLLYDTIPLKFPFTYTDEFVNRFEYWFKNVLQHASIFFSISSSTKNDVIDFAKYYGLTIPDVNVIRIGDNIPNDSQPSEYIFEKLSSDYVLSVGTIEYRKNHIALINAYRYMIQYLGVNPPKLYIAGRQGLYDAHVQLQVNGDPILRDKIEILSNLNDSDLSALYHSALFTVYPSIYEGWGLPVAESLCHGVPCITSNTSSMLEIAPSITPFANPLMTNEWVVKIMDWIEHPENLLKVREKIKNEYKAVTWNDVATELVNYIKTYLNHK